MSSNSYFGGMAFNLSRALILAAMFLTSIAQNEALSQYALDYGFTMGTANYLGDIGGDQLTRRDFAADLHLGQTKLSTHIFVRYRLSSAVAIILLASKAASLHCSAVASLTEADRAKISEIAFADIDFTLVARCCLTISLWSGNSCLSIAELPPYQ